MSHVGLVLTSISAKPKDAGNQGEAFEPIVALKGLIMNSHGF